jgi:hypothetical protein
MSSFCKLIVNGRSKINLKRTQKVLHTAHFQINWRFKTQRSSYVFTIQGRIYEFFVCVCVCVCVWRQSVCMSTHISNINRICNLFNSIRKCTAPCEISGSLGSTYNVCLKDMYHCSLWTFCLHLQSSMRTEAAKFLQNYATFRYPRRQ